MTFATSSAIKLQSVDAAGAHFGQPGYETGLLHMAGLFTWQDFFAILLGGSERLALDRLLLRRFKGIHEDKEAEAA